MPEILSEKIDVEVVIVAFNSEDSIVECLRSLPAAAGTRRVRVTVVDNASKVNVALAVERSGTPAQVLRQHENLGYAGGNNAGIRNILSEGSSAVLVLNPDVLLPAGAIEELWGHLMRSPGCGAISPWVTDTANDRGVPWFRSLWGVPIFSNERDLIPVDRLPGCCMLARTAVFENAAWFDESYFLYWEEIDWCVRIRRAGYELLVARDLRVIHHGDRRRGMKRHRIFYMWRNQVRFGMKNYGPLGGSIFFLRRLFANFREAVAFVADGRATLVLAGLAGLCSGLRGESGRSSSRFAIPSPDGCLQKLRVIVSHPARQAVVYHRPRAAERMGIEVRFLTGLYYRPGRFPYSLVRWLPRRKRTQVVKLLEKRRIEGLSPENVVSLLGPALEATLRPWGLIRPWNWAHDWMASRWISNDRGNAETTILHCFQGASLQALRAARKKGMLRLLEVTLPPLTDPASLMHWGVEADEFPDAEALKAELRESDFVLAQSEYCVRTLLDLGVPNGRILRLPLGVDTEYFRPRAGVRRTGPLRVLFVGSISRRKGVHHLLRAWNELGLEQGELVLAGRAASPGAADLLRPEHPRCRSLGHVSDPDLLDLLQQADMLVHPSLAEGGCNVVYEALACGLPCVVSSHAGSAVRTGIEGLVVRPGDIEGLKAAIRRLSTDTELRRQMATAARKRAESLSLDCFAARLGDIYRGLGEYVREGGRFSLETHF